MAGDRFGRFSSEHLGGGKLTLAFDENLPLPFTHHIRGLWPSTLHALVGLQDLQLVVRYLNPETRDWVDGNGKLEIGKFGDRQCRASLPLSTGLLPQCQDNRTHGLST